MRALGLTMLLWPSVALAQVAPAPAAAPDPGECTVTTTVRCTGVAAPYAVRGDGWRVVQSSDGSWWRERKVSTAAPTVWGTGLAFWLGGYAAGAIGGLEQGGVGWFGSWPIVGAFVSSAFSSGNAQALWAVDGLAQAGGFVTFLVGLAAGPDKLEHLPLAVGPMGFAGGGSGVALSGRF